MAAPSVNISVESAIEHQIQEVRYDGQEIYVAPLSMSENLSKLAHKIDFYKDESEEKGKPTSEGEKESDEEKVLAPFQPSLWPWDSVRNKLKAAYTEISVLYDVLNIVKEKHYMVTDPVNQDGPELKAPLQMLAKKRSLVAAAHILSNGAERLKRVQNEMASVTQENFLMELLKLRKNWRLKKVHNTILGELSYKSAGSRFWQGGTFEVLKTSDLAAEGEIVPRKSSLDVIIPSELEGVAYILVEVKSVVSDLMNITSATLKMPSSLGPVSADTYWQLKLETAQNVLFCKELFAQLAREAVQIKKASTPHMVVGNQILTNVFPGVQLSIVLCHHTGKEKKVNLSSEKLEHNHVLEHSLHQLLREVHDRNLKCSAPHPVNAMLGMTRKRRLAGPRAMSRQELMEMGENESLLEQILKQTKHAVLRIRSMHVIDQMAVSIQDPQLCAHWSCLNSSLESSVRVSVTSYGYESIRTSLVLTIGIDLIRVVMKDGRVCTLSFEETELRDLLQWQICQHHTHSIQHLAKVQGWQVLSGIVSSGFGDMEAYGTTSNVLMASPRSNVIVSFHSNPVSGSKLWVKKVEPSIETHHSPAVTANKWASLSGEFQEVNLQLLEGRNLVGKIDMLMARLSLS
ncbi:Mediator of RNA polymerase II transcription subunit 17 [Biomphalaria glabrata]|uniref:Mediator of RNA polymerase II transcription subunit 17 n=2 Tax=Biomphalaria glabrata TaxID=6526 RepID=A0A9W2ZZG4_BIOGL|nr:mediator of RNA polymerase II transcription subunit 17-like [Biomphalaria glabrata]KAI8740238.1 mediator of RNA polymerase II transcription subunit 17 [Biomphalaria glabrata]KAI8784768.1 mediator of RNA polymerase II transcription subunit 17 [Biomphalaria glabrata]